MSSDTDISSDEDSEPSHLTMHGTQPPLRRKRSHEETATDEPQEPPKKKRKLTAALKMISTTESFTVPQEKVNTELQTEKLLEQAELRRKKEYCETLREQNAKKREDDHMDNIMSTLKNLKKTSKGEYERMLEMDAVMLVRKNAELDEALQRNPEHPEYKAKKERFDKVADEFAKEFKSSGGRNLKRWDDYDEFTPKYAGRVSGDKAWTPKPRY